MPSKKKRAKNKNSFPIVGVGCSAGGLETLQSFFINMPPDSGMALVIIQHMPSDHKSMMKDILARYTKMKVIEITDGMALEQNHVYINPPSRQVNLLNGVFHMVEHIEFNGVRLPIDAFFRSLADDQGTNAVAIVMSGAGTDGTLGIRAVNEAGGMVMVQDGNSAKFSSMPQSAESTGIVDFILSPEDMPEALINYISQPYINKPVSTAKDIENVKDTMGKIILLIRSHSKNDFSQYKYSFLIRRIEKRMALHQLERMAHYLRYLQQTPSELDLLAKDMLVGVTRFFREPEAFDSMKEKVIPGLFEDRPEDFPVRIWVVGCSTGEEAYSIALLLKEFIDSNELNHTAQVFATEIDSNSVDRARSSIYPESIVSDVPGRLLKRYFAKIENGYQLKKEIRDMLVFATHNIVSDPPFSRIDLISCRNFLIYLNPGMQEKLLSNFQFALNSDGFLFLGQSEHIGGTSDLFVPVDNEYRIFRSTGIKDRRRISLSTGYLPPSPPGPVTGTKKESEQYGYYLKETPVSSQDRIRKITEDIFFQESPVSYVVVDGKYNIAYLRGNNDRFLSMPQGTGSWNLLNMLREEISAEVRTALFKAEKEGKKIISGLLSLTGKSGKPFILTVKPIQEPRNFGGFYMLIFELVRPEEHKGKKPDARISELEQEIEELKKSLFLSLREIDSSREYHENIKEELQSANEEQQSIVEELETSREELHANNEELLTVNSELKHKVNELSDVNNDMNNLLRSTEIGTIFLDKDLNIRFFTPAMKKIFNLIKDDIGRPIGHITPRFSYDGLISELKEVISSLETRETEIRSKEGQWYSMRILPYRTIEQRIDGVVMAFVDITTLKQAEEEIRQLNAGLEQRVEERTEQLRKSHESYKEAQSIGQMGHWEFDLINNNLKWSDEIFHIFGIDPEEFSATYEEFIETIYPEDRNFVKDTYASSLRDKTVYDIVHRIRLKDGTIKYVNEKCTTYYNENGDPLRSLGTVQDVTERRQMEIAARSERDRMQSILNSHASGIIIVNHDLTIDYANPLMEEVFGPVNGQKCSAYLSSEQDECPLCKKTDLFSSEPSRWEWEYREKGRSYDIYDTPFKKSDGSEARLLFFTDITERKRVEEEYRKEVEELKKLQ